MIIKWKSEYIGHVGFEAEPEDYDGIPRFSHYWVDAAPKNLHPDREALAAFLIFRGYIGGLTLMPHKFSPAVESAFRRTGDGALAFSPVEYYPKALPQGSRTLHLSWTGCQVDRATDGITADHAYLHIKRSDQFSGSIRSINSLHVAANAWAHSQPESSPLQRVFPYIAAAVLYAEDLEADSIQIYGDYDTESVEWKNLALLLGSARLGIKMDEQ